ncbi:hypothetical protein [Candidatus Nitrotoga arctica]|uniref:hypothetical protein n=1 Tax=Candidatus Nitrotoga arctica TaxID=453162 RepID=UPI003B967F3E
MPVRHEAGAKIRVFSGVSDVSGELKSPTQNHTPVTMVEIRLQPGAIIEQNLSADYNGFVVVFTGSAAIGAASTFVEAGQVAWLAQSQAPSGVSLTGGEHGVRGHPVRGKAAARGGIPRPERTVWFVETVAEPFATV